MAECKKKNIRQNEKKKQMSELKKSYSQSESSKRS